jgi:F-type H+-transporting ATPase subunit delta
MKVSTRQYSQALYDLTLGKSQKDINVAVANFVRTLAKNNQIKFVPAILEKFNGLWNKEHNIVEAEVTSAHELKEAQIKKIEKFVKEKYQAKEVVLQTKIDLNIKGGFVLKVGDEMIDSSIAKQLRVLKNQLVK